MASIKLSTKSVRRLEKPRPLKFTIHQDLSAQKDVPETPNICENIVLQLESIVKLINNCNYDHNLAAVITKVCQELKSYGSQLESQNIDQLDRYFKTLRDAAREDNLEPMCRLKLLEIIELRAMGWRPSDNLANYYRNRLFEAEQASEQQQLGASSPTTATATIPSSSSIFIPVTGHSMVPLSQSASSSSLASSVGPSALAPGEVLKSSGKYPKPTKVAAKNYYKDEIIIRNSDSGKVMGIKGRRVHMIEELSNTVISFQRVAQGAKDRPVQITGAQEESIQKAKQLIEGTIRRNASPIRTNENSAEDGCGGRGNALMHSLSMNDASIGEYQYTVNVGKDVLKLSGARLDLVRTARLVLEEYFAGDAERTVCDEEVDEDEEASPEVQRDSVERKTPAWNARNGHVGSGRIPLHRMSCDVDLEYSSDTDSSPLEDEDDEEDQTEIKETPVTEVFGVRLVKTGFNGGRGHQRQPLRTSASLDSFHKAEDFVIGSWDHRSHENSGQAKDTNPTAKTVLYTRHELLDLALSPLSHQTPFSDYSAVSCELENIIKVPNERISYFDPAGFRSFGFSSPQF